jgi:copper chaperone NosL
MNRRFLAVHRLLDRPLSMSARLVLLAGIATLVVGALLPLWRIRLVAPQYAEGLTLEMYAYKIEGGNNGQDLREINTLNHYIGMRPIEASDFAEMKWIPFAVGLFVLLGLRAAAIGRIGNLVDLGVLFAYFGAFSLGSFAWRLYTYGHRLDPHAPMRIDPFMPVVVGSQQIANFVQTSLPLAGTACLGTFLAAVVAAIWLSAREAVA